MGFSGRNAYGHEVGSMHLMNYDAYIGEENRWLKKSELTPTANGYEFVTDKGKYEWDSKDGNIANLESTKNVLGPNRTPSDVKPPVTTSSSNQESGNKIASIPSTGPVVNKTITSLDEPTTLIGLV